MNNLHLQDYKEGYRFRLLCQDKRCKYQWYEWPKDLLDKPYTHARLYLDELEALVPCPNCKRANSKITPIPLHKQHSFVGGLA